MTRVAGQLLSRMAHVRNEFHSWRWRISFLWFGCSCAIVVLCLSSVLVVVEGFVLPHNMATSVTQPSNLIERSHSPSRVKLLTGLLSLRDPTYLPEAIRRKVCHLYASPTDTQSTDKTVFDVDTALFCAGLAFDAYVEPDPDSSRWERGVSRKASGEVEFNRIESSRMQSGFVDFIRALHCLVE